MHEKDRPLAFKLRKLIGYGQIYPVLNKKAIKFVISKKKGIDHVVNLCDGHWVTNNKLKQLYNLGYKN